MHILSCSVWHRHMGCSDISRLASVRTRCGVQINPVGLNSILIIKISHMLIFLQQRLGIEQQGLFYVKPSPFNPVLNVIQDKQVSWSLNFTTECDTCTSYYWFNSTWKLKNVAFLGMQVSKYSKQSSGMMAIILDQRYQGTRLLIIICTEIIMHSICYINICDTWFYVYVYVV